MDEAGRVHRGARAAGEALARCRRPWSHLGRLLAWPPAAALAEPFYRLVAVSRHALTRLLFPAEACSADFSSQAERKLDEGAA